MKVFISWSGEPSRSVATALHSFLPRVLQALEPFVSTEDIRSGARWFTEIADKLEASSFGIFCLTPENQNAPWMLFEAGAISKAVGQSRVVPLLLEGTLTSLTGPWPNFQAQTFGRTSMLKLLQELNEQLGEKAISADHLVETFEAFWPKLEAAYQEALKEHASTSTTPRRSPEEILDEILQLARVNARSIERLAYQRERDYHLLTAPKALTGKGAVRLSSIAAQALLSPSSTYGGSEEAEDVGGTNGGSDPGHDPVA